jgi:serine/threonine protein kinase
MSNLQNDEYGAGARSRDQHPAAIPGDASEFSRNLPADLARRFTVSRELSASGGEADVFVVNASGAEADALQYVLKLYRTNIVPKQDVLERIKRAKIRPVVRLLDYGEAGGFWYEIQEFAPYGSLRAHMGRGPMPMSMVENCFWTVASAIEQIHALGVWHRDIKPDNILLRSEHPLDLALADFGISSLPEATLHLTLGARTVRYGAPELVTGSEVMITAAVDYWSLGMLLVELLTGVHPFEGLSDAVINNRLATAKNPIDFSTVPENWRQLCKGLLIRDPKQRWGAAQVRRWIAGERSLPVAEDVPSNFTPFHFEGREYWSLPDVLGAFAEQWSLGVKEIERGRLSQWVLKQLGDFENNKYIEDLRDDNKLTPDERLFILIARHCRGRPPIWKGGSLDRDNLAAMTVTGHGQDVLSEVYELRLLSRHDATVGGTQHAPLEIQWRALVESIEQAWRAVIARGAPKSQQPAAKVTIANALHALLSPGFVSQAKAAVRDCANRGARDCRWFRSLDGSPAALIVALVLAEDALDEGERARNRRRWAWRRISLVFAGVTNGLILGAAMAYLRRLSGPAIEAGAGWKGSETMSQVNPAEAASYANLLLAVIVLVGGFSLLQMLYYRGLKSGALSSSDAPPDDVSAPSTNTAGG